MLRGAWCIAVASLMPMLPTWPLSVTWASLSTWISQSTGPQGLKPPGDKDFCYPMPALNCKDIQKLALKIHSKTRASGCGQENADHRCKVVTV